MENNELSNRKKLKSKKRKKLINIESRRKEKGKKGGRDGGRAKERKRKETGAEIYEVENKHTRERINEVRS